MATSKVIPFSSSPQISAEVEPIFQIELGLLLSLRGRLKQIQDQVAAEEESLKTRLEAGAIVEVDRRLLSFSSAV